MTASAKQAGPAGSRKRLLLNLTRALLLGRALLGFVITAIYLVNYPPESLLMALLGLPAVYVLHSLILFLLYWGLGLGSRTLYWIGFAFMVLQLTLALITTRGLLVAGEQLGVMDIVDFLVSLLVLGLLIALRKMFGVRW